MATDGSDGKVLINGKTAVHKNSGGTLTTQDVCLDRNHNQVTFTNIAKSSDAANTAQTVFINGNPVCHQKSIFAVSKGDEGGVNKGVNSGTLTEKAEFIAGSPNVFIEGIPAVRQGELMVSNNQNTSPAQLAQPGASAPPSQEQINKATQKPKTLPDQIPFDVIGITPPLMQEQLCTLDSELFVPLGQSAENNNVCTRINLNNLTAGKKTCYLRIADQDGPAIKLPLGDNFETINEEAQQPDIGQAPNILVPLECRWLKHLNEGEKLNPKAGDLSEIYRLPSELREEVHKELLTHSADDLKTKPWTALITPQLKTLVNQTIKADKAESLRPGWLYVFVNGSLWRELEVTKDAVFSDVDLARYAGLDNRPASGDMNFYITVPFKTANTTNNIEITFSDVQWGWARVGRELIILVA